MHFTLHGISNFITPCMREPFPRDLLIGSLLAFGFGRTQPKYTLAAVSTHAADTNLTVDIASYLPAPKKKKRQKNLLEFRLVHCCPSSDFRDSVSCVYRRITTVANV